MEETQKERKNKRKSSVLASIGMVLFVGILAFATLSWQNPPPEPAGTTVNLGIPDVGQGEESAPGKPAPPVETKPEPVKETTPTPPKAEPEKTAKPKTTPKKKVKETVDPEAERLKKRREEDRKRKAAEDAKKAAAEKKKREAAAEAKRQADAKKAAEEAKRKALEDAISGGLGSGSGKGNTGTSGTQGNPDGTPNSDNLSGISGAGNIGGALGGRGISSKPGNFRHSCPQTGKVVIWVCADQNGNVTKAEFRQSGSEVNASCNKNAAIKHAKKYKFQKSDRTDCGPITYFFKVQ